MKKINDRFSVPLRNALSKALVMASERGQTEVLPEHILGAIVLSGDSPTAVMLASLGMDIQALMTKIGDQKVNLRELKDLAVPKLSTSTQTIFEKAMLVASLQEQDKIELSHVIYGFATASRDPKVTKLLEEVQLSAGEIRHALDHSFVAEKKTGEKEKTALEYFCVELTGKNALAKLPPLFGRDVEIDRLIDILNRRTKNNPLLLGEPGVGKTAIVEGLALRIASGKVPDSLKTAKIFTLDMSQLVAGSTFRGDFEAKLLDIIEEVKGQKNIILFIDELHSLVGAGDNSGALDAANILKPALGRGEIKVIGATTPGEYKAHLEKDGALTRRFNLVRIEEPSESDTIKYLNHSLHFYTDHHGQKVTESIVKEIVELTGSHVTNRRFPDKAFDLLDEVLSAAKREKLVPSIELTREVASRMFALPITVLNAHQKTELIKLADRLGSLVVGQELAIAKVAPILIKGRLGINDSQKPLASFIFTGPSGVGKSKLAKAIAEEFLGEKAALLRLDMSEYNESHSVSKLIGAPPGYVGFKERSRLVDAIKERPSRVIVFDELEKAHKDVQHLLLQILEEGELIDSLGEKVSLRGCVVIATTNAAKDKLERSTIGFTPEKVNENDLRMILKEKFSEELINRFETVVMFQPLQSKSLQIITKQKLDDLAKRLEKKSFSISFDQELVKSLAATVNSKHGARDVSHVIADQVEKVLIDKLMSTKTQSKKIRLVRHGGKVVAK